MSAPVNVDVRVILRKEVEHAGCLGPRASDARAKRLQQVLAAVDELIEAAKHGREWIVEVGDRKGLPNGGTVHRLDAALARVGGAA